MTKHCNSRTTMGHGEVAVCGQQFYSGVYQCPDCKLFEVEAELANFKAMYKRASEDSITEAHKYFDLNLKVENAVSKLELAASMMDDDARGNRFAQVCRTVSEGLKGDITNG